MAAHFLNNSGSQTFAMADAPKKLYIKTHGCQMNEYDSARIQDLLGVSHALEPTDNPEEADVLLLNTCSIREKAQEKVFHQLGRWKQLKDKNPALVIGVGGCVASQEGADIGLRAPYVDVIFGPQTLHRVPDMLDARKPDGPIVVDVTFPEIEKFDRLPEPSADGQRVCFYHGRLLKVLYFLCGSLHPRRRSQPPAG